MAIGSDSQALGRIEGGLDMLKDLVTEVRNDQKHVAEKAVELATKLKNLDDHEKRIQDLEHGNRGDYDKRIKMLEDDRSYIRGWIAAAGVIGGAIVGFLYWLVGILTRPGKT